MPLPESIRTAMERLEQNGFACYAVGGCVRDWLAGEQPHDYDLCTAASPQQTMSVFSDKQVIETGLQHGTVTVMLDGEPVEITTFRTESGYSDSRHPDTVQFVTEIEQDLARRDFTINAMAWSPVHGLCDPFGGAKDLKHGIIRCVGDADIRLTEDALRILRALRFASVRGFTIEPETAQALRRNQSGLKNISAERITSELLQILCGCAVGEILMEYADIITNLLPELKPMVGFEQNNPYHKYAVWEHSVRAVEAIRPDSILRLTMLCHDSGKPETYVTDEQGVGHFYGHPKHSQRVTEELVKHLRLSAKQEERLLYLVRHHDTPLGRKQKHIRRKLAVHGEAYFRDLLAVKKADCIGQGTCPQNVTELLETEQLLEQVLAEDTCLKIKDLALNGHDLIAMGLQGKEIGRCLSAMLNYVLDDPKRNTRQQLAAFFGEWAQNRHTIELTVSGMSAACCIRQVKEILGQFSEISKVTVSLDSGCVTINCIEPISQERIQNVLSAAGYEVAI